MVTALNKIRLGIYDAETAQTLSPCMYPGSIDAMLTKKKSWTKEKAKSNEDEEIEPTILHSHNAMVDNVNQRHLDNLMEKPYTYKVRGSDVYAVYVE